LLYDAAMRFSRHPEALSATDAEARLRYVQDVRRRTRHTTLPPVLMIGILGALVMVRGMLLLYWPHVAGLSAAWFIGVSLGGTVIALWLEDRQRMQTGVQPLTGGRPAIVVVAFAVVFIAHAIGANVVIAAIGVPLALAEWRSGTRTAAAAIVVIGLISEALVLQGTRQWAALVIFGAGLVAVGLVGRWTRQPA
jgi:hypothetical protein